MSLPVSTTPLNGKSWPATRIPEKSILCSNVFNEIRVFCLDTAECNCFLLDKDMKGPKVDAIHELVDLKLLHLVRSRVTVKYAARSHF